MKALAIGDLHGNVALALDLAQRERPSILLSTGDWGDPGQVAAANMERLTGVCYVLTVYGNHDDLPLLASLRNADGSPVLLAGRREVSGLSVAGISGIWAKSHRQPHYVTDEDVDAAAAEVAGGGPVDVLLTHGCPIGVCDQTSSGRHGGQRCFLDAAERIRPRLHLCGHLHLAQHRSLRDGRQVANTGFGLRGDYCIIEWADGAPRVAFFNAAQ
jgi:Icc-related predicted phosphoesterase